MSKQRPPNIVLIMTDQQQARACAREGFPLDTTPTLDRLAAAGAWFDHGYTTAPICLPARVSLLTGQFPSATGAVANGHAAAARASAALPELLRTAGYATALVGKNHSHLGADSFDHHFGLSHGGAGSKAEQRDKTEAECDKWLRSLHHGVATTACPFPVEATPPARAVTETCRWIDEVTDQPFFVWLSIPEPHNPFYAPEPYFSMFAPDELPPVIADAEAGAAKGFPYRFLQRLERKAIPGLDELMPRYRANYYGMLRLIDDQFGRLVSHLEGQGRLAETLFIAVSDHGDYVGDYGLMRKGAGVSDSLMRIPFVCSGAGVRPLGRHNAHVSLVDIVPTLCDATGIPIPADVQGRSLWPLLRGEEYPPEEFASILAEKGFGGQAFDESDNPDYETWTEKYANILFHELGPFTQSGTTRMLRRRDWKLVVDGAGGGELYNVAADPAELHNRYDDPDCTAVRGELALELAQRLTQFQPINPEPGRDMQLKRPAHNWWRGRATN